MRSRRLRRRYGLVLTGLILFQGIAMPLGVCAQGHEEHEGRHVPAHDVTTAPAHPAAPDGGHVHGGHGAAVAVPDLSLDANRAEGTRTHSEAPGSIPTDCVAMSGCGAPALSRGHRAELHTGALLARQAGRRDSSRPPTADLGIATPPPKI